VPVNLCAGNIKNKDKDLKKEFLKLPDTFPNCLDNFRSVKCLK